MPARQYKPFSYKVLGISLIVYPVKDENPLDEIYDPMDSQCIQEHLDKLYKQNKELLGKGDYHILFV